MNYVPPTIECGLVFSGLHEYELGPGVLGFAFQVDGVIYIPAIRAAREGAGDVGRFLDTLSPDCRIENLISRRLAMMLARRGWRPVEEHRDGDVVDVWVHRDAEAPGPLMTLETVLEQIARAGLAAAALRSFGGGLGARR